MNQRFIELGEGFGDVFELCELIRTNAARFTNGFIFASENPDGKPILSVAAAFSPGGDSNFTPIYICREGIQPESKRLRMAIESMQAAGKEPISLDVKPSRLFADKELYYSYLIGILRLNHFLPPLR
ncbi:DUF7147 family protein [Indiicoccus explosivorum]|uniref:DUF7147 family protein n=1 Tax=Indiicoccus explosivorum TaxID=1917864 RepID=UPI000B4383E7|nr:methylthioribose kinase [Indiicoccus explosivorum]